MADARLPLLVLMIAAAARNGENNDSKPEGLLSRVASRATGAVVDIVDPEKIVEQIDVNALLERVDVNDLMDRVDVNALLDRVDINEFLDRVDVDALMARVDVNDLMDRVDVDALMARVDVNALLNRVDMNKLLDRVGIDELLDRVDINALLDRVDINELLDRADINDLMDRVDINALLDRVDVRELTERAGIPDIVKESTTSLFGSALDVFRRQAVALDQIIGRATYSVIGRDPKTRPVAPAALAGADGVAKDGKAQVTGHFAGSATRLAAFMADSIFIWVAFVVIAFGLTFVVEVVLGFDLSETWQQSAVGIAIFILWVFTYTFVGLALAGRTLGMGLVGIRVVNRQGTTITGRQALVRTLVFPLSFLAFGLGFVGIFISPTRRTLHDAAAGTVVVYDWGDRPAEMSAPLTRWVNQHADDVAPGNVAPDDVVSDDATPVDADEPMPADDPKGSGT